METRNHKQLSSKEYRCSKDTSGPAVLCGPIQVNLQQVNEHMLEGSVMSVGERVALVFSEKMIF